MLEFDTVQRCPERVAAAHRYGTGTACVRDEDLLPMESRDRDADC